MRNLQRGLALALMLLSASAMQAHAGFAIGSSYHVSLTNAPVNGSVDVTLDLTTKVVVPNLTVTETLYFEAPNSQWIDLYFETINGGPIAGNINASWQINVSGLDVTVPALGTGFYNYWTVNDVPVNPIFPFGAIGGVAPIPTNPGAGPAYTATGFPPYGPLSEFATFLFVNPYSFASNGGIPVSTANGFHMGVRIQETGVPEPSTIAAAIGGMLLVAGAARRRTRKS